MILIEPKYNIAHPWGFLFTMLYKAFKRGRHRVKLRNEFIPDFKIQS